MKIVVWSDSGRSWAVWWPIEANLRPSWSQDEPTCDLDGHIGIELEAVFFLIFRSRADLSQNSQSANTNDSTSFSVDFGGREACLDALGGCFGRSWLYIERSWVMSALCCHLLGELLALRWPLGVQDVPAWTPRWEVRGGGER